MKAVLISIRPEWCELIATGEKTVEVRKTAPTLEKPFKVYIYCTKSMTHLYESKDPTAKEVLGAYYTTQHNKTSLVPSGFLNGKVIGEFVCDDITKIRNLVGRFIAEERSECETNTIARASCLDFSAMKRYLGTKDGYAWHISDLLIYDEPRSLGEFYKKCEATKCEGCEHLKYQRVNPSEYDYDCEYLNNKIPIARPPQSWCYVEEVDR